MSCAKCPCPDVCRGLAVYCEWAAKEPPDPVEIRHICDASRRHGRTDADYPPAADQAANLARSLWDWATSGLRMASDAEVDRRREICAACPEWDVAARRCRKCGCYTEAKIRMRTEHCPLDPPRW